MKQRLGRAEPVIGSWISSASPVVAELMAGCGFDFLAVDAEHSAVDVPQALRLLQAIRSGDPSCAGMVRVPAADHSEITRYMDAGADGVICPMVETQEQAAEVVAAVKYPPSGGRGVGYCRDNQYGLRLDERVASANDETVVCLQIESAEGVRNLDRILEVAGIDAVMIGPYDLSASLGVTGRFDHPDFLEAKRRIVDGCLYQGVVAGIHIVRPEPTAALAALAEGYRLIAYGLDISMLAHCSRQGLEEIRAGLATDSPSGSRS